MKFLKQLLFMNCVLASCTFGGCRMVGVRFYTKYVANKESYNNKDNKEKKCRPGIGKLLLFL